MCFNESHSAVGRSNLVLIVAGLILLSFGLFTNLVEILKIAGFPVSKLYGERGQADLVSVRILAVVVSIGLITFQLILWKKPFILGNIAQATNRFVSAASKLPLFTTLFLGAVLLVKMVLELSLYLIGYQAYSGDDFGRALKAYQWLQSIDKGFDLTTWLNLGTPQLPFPDYLFGLALALYRDVYITPKVMNLFLSSIVVIVVYLLGRELFGRAAGLFAAILCAFQPWIIWLGLSGMTSDLPSVVMIALFALFLLRWLENNQAGSLLAAAVCLFIATGMRYENWFFAVIFSLFLGYRFISDARMGRLTGQAATTIVSALVIGNAFPIFHMAASYYVLSNFIPGMQNESDVWGYDFLWPRIMATDSFKGTVGAPVAKINMVLWALSAFPLEIAAAMGGIALFLKSNGRKPPRVYVLITVATFLLFVIVFKGRLPLNSTGERFFLPYVILLLPFAGFLFVRLFHAYRPAQPVYSLLAALLLLTLGTFDIMRAFNYPAKKYDRDAFAAGWTLRMLQGVGSVSEDGQILIDKGRDEDPIPFPIVVLGNKPERFVSLVDGDVGKACYSGLETQECKKRVFDGTFDMIILSSSEKVHAFQRIFSGRSWQIGNYHIFELNGSSKDNESSARPLQTTLINGSAGSPRN